MAATAATLGLAHSSTLLRFIYIEKGNHIPSNPELWTMDSVKTAVIQLLREMSQSKLAKICPLKQSLLSTIVNNKFTGKLGAEKCKEFGTWFMQYRQSSPASAMAFLDEDRPPQDGRMTFHSITELPRMRDWFRQCPHPTNLQLQDFANQLNSESLRLRNKPKVTVNCLKNWWKNERQRERRTSKRRSPGGVDDDSNPGNSASSSSTHCPVPIKIAAAVTTASTTATACIIHQHRSPSSPPAHSPSPQPSQPQVTRPSAPSFSSTPHNRPQHPVVTLATHDYGARAAAAMMPLRHLHHLHHHHHHPRFVPASSGGVVPAASSSPGDLVVALSTTSPS